ncbi:tetratricopeptide repeat protein [Massilia sp. BJB1822]|uniref:tetratricopeptide repeat protein n=1 Tax=Massilia sp. BJB1822 TaxID=2744470 RepID=UPI0015946895|nr:tetratricopeptide repeat protein [Massilia sp. BJB1822]NVD97776.1 tetratricopeptide repeat protein [Massilia sp. BJB1822]
MKAFAIPVISLLVWMAWPARVDASPRIPGNDAEVLEILPRRADEQTRELRRMRAELNAAPHQLQLATALARRYIEAGRRESDPRYFGHAQAVLQPWWQEASPPPEVRLLRAMLLQNSHRFAEAQADLVALTARNPGDAQAWLSLATVRVTQGQYAEAKAACARLSLLASPLAGAACIANAGSLSGNLAQSERLLRAVLERYPDEAAGLRAWAQTLLAEMAARRGDAAAAEQSYRSALALDPRDSYLLGAYADFLLDRNRADEVIGLLRVHGRTDALLLRYALALRQSGRDAAALAAASNELQARFQAAAMRGDTVHQREEARYALHLRADSKTALRLALANWQGQKEVADARILLEAALAANEPQAAVPAMRWISAVGMEDGALASLLGKLASGARRAS